MAVSVTVCVGSSCHVRGSREMLKRFAEIIREQGLEDEVTLSGSFCMEHCGEGMNWKFGEDEVITSESFSAAEAELRRRLGERHPGG